MKIEIKAGPNAGQQHDIEGATVIGRDPATATLVIDDPEASRRHAQLTPGGDGVTVEDLGSTNGTFVNDERVEGSRNAGAGDEIRIGTTVIEVQSTIEATRMSEIPSAPPDADATAIGSPVPDAGPQSPPAPEPAASEPPAADTFGGPPAPEPAASEPPAADTFGGPPAPEPPGSPAGGPPPPPAPSGPPSYDPPTSEPPAAPQAPEPVASAPEPPSAPPPPPPGPGGPPPPGGGQGYGSPQQGAWGQQQGGYASPPPQMGQPGGAMAPGGYTAANPIKTRESVVEWLLCYFVPFYSLFWFHRANQEIQQWSGGRIDYNAGSSLAAITVGWFILVPPFVAWASFMGRIRTAQQMAGLQPTANFWGSIGRMFLLGYGYKWHQDQFNEIAVRQPQG